MRSCTRAHGFVCNTFAECFMKIPYYYDCIQFLCVCFFFVVFFFLFFSAYNFSCCFFSNIFSLQAGAGNGEILLVSKCICSLLWCATKIFLIAGRNDTILTLTGLTNLQKYFNLFINNPCIIFFIYMCKIIEMNWSVDGQMCTDTASLQKRSWHESKWRWFKNMAIFICNLFLCSFL